VPALSPANVFEQRRLGASLFFAKDGRDTSHAGESVKALPISLLVIFRFFNHRFVKLLQNVMILQASLSATVASACSHSAIEAM
jgi:hypothetical protein